MKKTFFILFSLMFFLNISIGQKSIKGFTYYSDSVTNGFYVKNTEVTIEEYLEFVDWVVDSISRRVLGEEFPNTFLTSTFDEELEVMSEGYCRLDWDAKLRWDNPEYYPLLISELVLPENQRFYKRRTIDYRNIKFQNSKRESINIIPYCYLITIPSREKTIVSYRLKKSFNLLRTGEKEINSNDFIVEGRFSPEQTIGNANHNLDNKKPISNISYNQAEAYCEWKTNQLNKKSKKLKYYCKIPNINEYKKIWGIIDENYEFVETKPSSFSPKKENIDNYYYLDYLDYFNKYNELRDSLKYSTGYKVNNYDEDYSGVLDGVYIQEKDKELEITEVNTVKYYNSFRNSRDYFSYENNKNLVGLDNNLSEWINSDIEEKNIKHFTYKYRDIEIMPVDTTNSKLAVGGNWWNGEDKNGKTFISKDKELETIGFRYIMYIKEPNKD